MSRAGGANQLSREVDELAKQTPDRVLTLISHLQPHVHEQYAGEAVRGLIGTDLSPEALIDLIEDLDNRGFRSTEFCDDIALRRKVSRVVTKDSRMNSYAGCKRGSQRNQNQLGLSRLIAAYRNTTRRNRAQLLWIWDVPTLTHARGSITRAIADGYLKRDPPDVEGWSRFIESRLTSEQHPRIWAEILTRMVILFQRDRWRATRLFDEVIKGRPNVLRYPFALNAIAHVLRG